MPTADVGWLKTTNGLVMLINLAAAIAAIVFWELEVGRSDLKHRGEWSIYYTCALAAALVIVAVIFFLTLCGKLTKRIVAIIFLIIAVIMVIIGVILVLVYGDRQYKTLSLMCASLLSGGIIANLVYTGVGGLKITT